jgi:hypothetical protein
VSVTFLRARTHLKKKTNPVIRVVVATRRFVTNIVVNLSIIANWYVEVEFSYLRVFSTSVPLNALPLFIPDKLACPEITR